MSFQTAAAQTGALQVFFWAGTGTSKGGRTYYQSFCLDNIEYHIGDCVFLFPEHESSPHYVGRIVSAFVDESAQSHAGKHCIELKWYERRTNLETTTRGIEESEREVFELEELDVNPIGCISGKCQIVKARSFNEAYHEMGACGEPWFFCRGYFLQATSSFQPYSEAELAVVEGCRPQLMAQPQLVPQSAVHHMPSSSQHQPSLIQQPLAEAHLDPYGADPDVNSGEEQDEPYEPTPPRRQSQQSQGVKRKGGGGSNGGRCCVECGATSTPQWREGPAGPKTLCNACGLRFVRGQQRHMKKGGSGGSKASGGGSKARANGQRAGGGSHYEEEDLYYAAPVARMRSEDMEARPGERPVRQAARAAANRTAAWAMSSGDYSPRSQDEGDALGQAFKAPRMTHTAGPRSGLDSARMLEELSSLSAQALQQQQRVQQQMAEAHVAGHQHLDPAQGSPRHAHGLPSTSEPLLPHQMHPLQSGHQPAGSSSTLGLALPTDPNLHLEVQAGDDLRMPLGEGLDMGGKLQASSEHLHPQTQMDELKVPLTAAALLGAANSGAAANGLSAGSHESARSAGFLLTPA